MPAKKTNGKSSTSAAKTKRVKKSTASKTKENTAAQKVETSDETQVVTQVVTPDETQVVTPVETQVVTPVETQVAESTSASTSNSSSTSVGAEQLEADYNSLMTRLGEFKTLYTGITSDLRRLQKNMNRYIREASKRSRKPKNIDPNRPKRPPSGFAKPALISTELCNFLSVPDGTEMARTEVTKHLTNYIKEHNLQDQENKRRILPDTALQSLLNVGAGEDLTYFNLQKYMKVHFPKSASATASA